MNRSPSRVYPQWGFRRGVCSEGTENKSDQANVSFPVTLLCHRPTGQVCVCVCDCVRDCDMLPKPGRPCLMCISPHQPRHGTSSKLCTDGDTNDKRAPCFGGFLPLQYRTGSIMLYLICPLLQRVVVALRVEGPGHGISNWFLFCPGLRIADSLRLTHHQIFVALVIAFGTGGFTFSWAFQRSSVGCACGSTFCPPFLFWVFDSCRVIYLPGYRRKEEAITKKRRVEKSVINWTRPHHPQSVPHPQDVSRASTGEGWESEKGLVGPFLPSHFVFFVTPIAFWPAIIQQRSTLGFFDMLPRAIYMQRQFISIWSFFSLSLLSLSAFFFIPLIPDQFLTGETQKQTTTAMNYDYFPYRVWCSTTIALSQASVASNAVHSTRAGFFFYSFFQ